MKLKDKIDLLRINSFETSQYEHYALTTLTAYCVYWLHEWEITTSLENVSVASHRMFPTKFALVGWPQFPDINRTNRSVLQMRPKYRNLATSVSDKGVFLNENGIREAKTLAEKLGPPILEGESMTRAHESLIKAERGTGKARSVHPEDLVKTVHRSQLFKLYNESRLGEAEAIHLIGLLGVYDHTPSRDKKRRLKEMMDAAKEIRDERTTEFLEIVSDKFQRYLSK